MKRDNLKKYFTLAALLTVFTLGSFAQASEETENSKKSDEKTEAQAAKTDDIEKDTIKETTEEVINTVTISANDNSYSQAEKKDDKETDNTNDYADNTFGTYTEGQVTKETPITVFPNPMVTSATIRFYNPDKSAVTIDIYDNLGRVILHVPDLLGYEYEISKDVIPEGIYYVKVKKKTSGDGEEDDDNDLLVKEDNTDNDVVIYTTKLVVN